MIEKNKDGTKSYKIFRIFYFVRSFYRLCKYEKTGGKL